MAAVISGRGLTPANATPYVTNADPVLLPKWASQLDKVRDGIADAVIVCDGDSTTFGFGSAPTSGDQRSHSYPAHLAAIIAASTGLGASAAGVAGFRTGATNGQVSLYDARITLRGTTNPGVTGIGGLAANWSAAGGMDFAPAGAFNTAEIAVVANGCQFSWGVDGGATTTVTTASTLAVTRYTLPLGSVGTHSLNLNWVSGSLYLMSLSFYDGTRRQVRVIAGGASGAKVGDMTANSSHWDPLKMISEGALGQCLLVDMWGINDWNAATSVSSFGASIAARIAAAKAAGDVILMSGVPSDPSQSGNASLAVQSTYVAEMRRQAVLGNVPFIDNWSRYGGLFSTMNANGLFYDDKHPKGAGYANIARAVARGLLAAS